MVNTDAEKGLLEAESGAANASTSCADGHAHNPKAEVKSQRLKLCIMIGMTFVVFWVELFYGYVANSMALIADSFHMLSDVLALTVALACILIANRRSKTNTFGWVRAEVLGALVNGVFLLALCFTIFIESIERLIEPHALKEPFVVLIVGVIGLVVNLIGMFLFHGHSHGHSHSDDRGESQTGLEEVSYLATSHQDGAMAIAELKNSDSQLNNGTNRKPTLRQANKLDESGKPTNKKPKNASQLNMKGVYLHIITDFIGSVIVILTASISVWFPELTFFKLYMDPGLSMVMVVLIMSSTIPLVKETALILLQTTPDDVDVKTIEQKMVDMPGVIAVHEFHVWRLVGVRIIATVHVRFASFDDYTRLAEPIRELFHDHKVHSVTIQPEFTEMTETDDYGCLLKCQPENCQAATCCIDKSITSPKTSSGGPIIINNDKNGSDSGKNTSR